MTAGTSVPRGRADSLPDDTKAALPGVFVRGLAMGIAESVPGVSGGTIAFVTGIYDELARSLASFSGGSAAMLMRQGWRAFARQHNLLFLAMLGAGMAVSFLAAAKLILALIESHGVYVSGFFFGLIAGSVFQVGAESGWRWLLTTGLAGLAAGIAASVFLDAGVAARSGTGAVAIFVAGALAATAWILPGVSGAFMLVLLGLYQPMLEALAEADFAVVAPFVAGLGMGLLAFSKVLVWLLARARAPCLALLTGFMAGSLIQLWPWRETTAGTGAVAGDPALLGVLAAMAGGALTIGVLAIATRRKSG